MDSFAQRAGDMREPAKLLECVPFEHVFLPPWQVPGARPWPTDAHFVTYTIVDPRQPPESAVWPRCNKSLLPELRTRGCELMATMIVLDYDNPGHRRWQEGEVQSFANAMVDRARNGFWLAMAWTSFYTTRHGARLVYVLKSPMPVDQVKGYVLGIIRDFRSQGVVFDDACKDWTRLFRAPYVVRQMEQGRQGTPGYATWKENSWEDPHFQTCYFPDNRLDLSFVTPAQVGDEVIATNVELLDLPKPDIATCGALLEEINPDTQRKRSTDWYKSAKSVLQGKELFGPIFEQKPLAMAGSRMNTLQSYVGSACAILSGIKATQPELIFALFLPSVLQLQPDESTPDWTEELWGAILRYWAMEEAKLRELEQLHAAVQENIDALNIRVLAGFRRWCKHPSLHQQDTEALAWMSEHLIAAVGGRFYFIMKPDGYYDAVPVTGDTLIARVRALGMDQLIQIRVPKADGDGFRRATSQELINQHATVVRMVEGVVGGDGSSIRNIDTEDARFMMRLYYRRTDLKPEFNAHVDRWLRLLAGLEYPRLAEWLAHSLAVEDGPICCLSIDGAPGCGKKMLLLGLTECFNLEGIADSGDFGKFQSGLLYSPFLSVNEGFKHQAQGARDIADTFRALVAGDPTRIEEKYKPPVTCRIPVRVLITANNAEAVSLLTGNRDLTFNDRQALAIRLLHVRVSWEAGQFLKSLGGHSYTAAKGNRWVTPESGGETNYIVAKHFLWLYENRRPPMRGQRFLVEGQADGEVERLMRVRAGNAPEIVETILAMIESDTVIQGCAVDLEGQVWMTTSGVLRFHRSVRATFSGKAMALKQVAGVLRSVAQQDTSDITRRIMTTKGQTESARWFLIDTGIIMGEALEHGYPCKKLERILTMRAGNVVHTPGQPVNRVAGFMN